MRDILADVNRWRKEGASIGIATVLQTWGSSPRRVGAKMAFTNDGRIVGSVSGGCVENAVVEAGLESLKNNKPQLLHFGVADETAWEVGLACGGSIDIFVQPLNEMLFHFLRSVWETGDDPSVHVTVIRGAADVFGHEFIIRADGTMIGSHWDSEQIQPLANETFRQEKSQRATLDDGTEIFLEYISPPSTLILVGGVHIAIVLASLAKTLGYRTVLVDPRRAWGNEERFPDVDQRIPAWPQEAFGQVRITSSTAIAMLTHDPKIDDPALKIALASPAFYVGALGSKTTNAKRRERLLNEGMTESQLSRLHAPIGVDIGAETPEEIALAVMAEVVKAHRKRDQFEVQNEAKLVPSPVSDP